MVLPRAPRSSPAFRTKFSSTPRGRATGRHWQQIGRRFYSAEQHTGAKKASSDLPWLIGSVGITVPSAVWLWQQNPKRRAPDHEHGHGEHQKQEEDGHGEQVEEGEEASAEVDQDSIKGDEEQKEDVENDSTGDEKAEKRDEQQPSGEAAKNEAQESSSQTDSVGADADKGEKEESSSDTGKASGPHTNSMHPYMAEPGKSQKGEGVVDTAKLHGTVDSNRPLR